MYYEELFYQMGCQNGSNSIEKQLVELKQKKKKNGSTSEVESCQTGPNKKN
jgi:hypothetical protein